MYSGKRVTIGESKYTNILEKFDKIIGELDRSKSVLKILQFFEDYDPNYLRSLLGLTPLTEYELQELQEMKPRYTKKQKIKNSGITHQEQYVAVTDDTQNNPDIEIQNTKEIEGIPVEHNISVGPTTNY